MVPSDPACQRSYVAAEIRRLGRTFTPDILKATYALFAPLQQRAPKNGIEIQKDLAYGEHERHRLDVFVPAQTPARTPIVAYFHGGGYIGGERSPLAGLIYDNVPTFFARHGMIGVNATYRLAPEHRWPSGGADVGRVVAWLRANAGRFGGDPDRIILMGQSAGATHVATWTFVPEVHRSAGPQIAGVILLSGVFAPSDPEYYRAEPPERHRVAYFGEDSSKWPSMNPVNHVARGHPPTFISVTEFDPYPLQWGSLALLEALVKCDKAMPWFVYSRNHNHVSPALQINSEVDDLGPELLEFVRSIA